jgi:hypothetical protein
MFRYGLHEARKRRCGLVTGQSLLSILEYRLDVSLKRSVSPGIHFRIRCLSVHTVHCITEIDHF